MGNCDWGFPSWLSRASSLNWTSVGGGRIFIDHDPGLLFGA